MAMMPWAIAGASIGTRMKSVNMNDMTRAMASPSNWSRIMARVAIFGPDTPTPCSSRPRMTISSEPATMAMTVPSA